MTFSSRVFIFFFCVASILLPESRGLGNGLSVSDKNLRGLSADKQHVCHFVGHGHFHTLEVAAQGASQHLAKHANDITGSCFGKCDVACRHQPCHDDFTSVIRESDARAGCICNSEAPSHCTALQICQEEQCVEAPPDWEQVGSDLDGKAADDSFGLSGALSKDGETVAVGAPGAAGYAGQIQVFRLLQNRFVQLGKDINGNLTSRELIGHSVAISADGNTVAVGTQNSVQVHRFNDRLDDWVQLGDTLFRDANTNPAYKYVSLSSDGNILAIGAPYNDGPFETAGHVRVYKYDRTWLQLGSGIFGTETRDLTGASVSLSADGYTVAVGSPGNDEAGFFTGRVRVFVFNTTLSDWQKLGEDLQGNNLDDQSGSRVSLSRDGKTVAIGMPYSSSKGNIGSGHVSVYYHNGNRWSQLGDDIDAVSEGDHFGWSVSLSDDGKILAVGALLEEDKSTAEVGAVHVYKFDSGTWEPLGSTLFGDYFGDRFGSSVSLSANGNTLAVGSSNHKVGAERAGIARVFQWRP